VTLYLTLLCLFRLKNSGALVGRLNWGTVLVALLSPVMMSWWERSGQVWGLRLMDEISRLRICALKHEGVIGGVGG